MFNFLQLILFEFHGSVKLQLQSKRFILCKINMNKEKKTNKSREPEFDWFSLSFRTISKMHTLTIIFSVIDMFQLIERITSVCFVIFAKHFIQILGRGEGKLLLTQHHVLFPYYHRLDQKLRAVFQILNLNTFRVLVDQYAIVEHRAARSRLGLFKYRRNCCCKQTVLVFMLGFRSLRVLPFKNFSLFFGIKFF